MWRSLHAIQSRSVRFVFNYGVWLQRGVCSDEVDADTQRTVTGHSMGTAGPKRFPNAASGLSYAEHMLHDTMQMTRRSAAAAVAAVDEPKQQTSHPAGTAWDVRAKTFPANSVQKNFTFKARRAGGLSQSLRSNCTVPRPFQLAVDQRASSPRIGAHKLKQV